MIDRRLFHHGVLKEVLSFKDIDLRFNLTFNSIFFKVASVLGYRPFVFCGWHGPVVLIRQTINRLKVLVVIPF